MRMARTLATVIAGSALSAGSLALAAAPAHAAPKTPLPWFDCKYPYACVYNSDVDIIGRYQDVTSGFQSITSTGVYYALNTRNDDVVYIRFTNGDVVCLPANDKSLWYLRDIGIPNGIRISSSDTCGSTPTAKKANVSGRRG